MSGTRITPQGKRAPWPHRRVTTILEDMDIVGNVGGKAPGPVLWSAVAWATAVACGVAESAVALTGMIAAGEGVPWPGLALRVVVYASAALVVMWFARGHRWARVALVLGLGVVGGLGTLITPVVLAALEGGEILDAMGASNGPLYLVLRTAHIASVAAAVAVAFTPSANRFFAGTGARVADAS